MTAKHFVALAILALLASACSDAPGTAPASQEETAPAEEAPADTPEKRELVHEIDALDPGVPFHATTKIRCGFGGNEPTLECEAGVIREWGEDRTTLVDITKPDGTSRALFFLDGQIYGADAGEEDGSVQFDLDFTDDGVNTTVTFGPETYIIPFAFVLGS